MVYSPSDKLLTCFAVRPSAAPPVVPSAVSYEDVRLRRESSMEECRKTSGIQVPDEPLELSAIDHSMG